MTTETAAKKDIQKLQRVIVDALEDVKGQEIVVFDTETLSALFERVIIASGTSNRQTRALAASVRDAVRDAGFGKPRIEGEENGEWIIVDCGAAVVHIMQPTIRAYYHLEEIWGEKPVRLKFGAPKPELAAAEPKAKAKPVAKKAAGKSATGPRTAGQKVALKTAPAKAATPRAAVKAAPAKSAPVKVAPAKKVPSKTVAVKAVPSKTAVAKPRVAAPAKTVKTVTVAKPASKSVAAKKTSRASSSRKA